MPRQIVKMLFGSHVYGTNTPSSDTDYKGVYIPSVYDILLGRAPKTSDVKSTGSSFTKNSSDDVDIEMFTLQGYLRVAQEGQVVALDMLFAPENFWITVDPIWHEIRANKDKILCKGTTAYVGYCQKQAGKYDIKGSRMGDCEALINFLSDFNPKERMSEIYGLVKQFAESREHVKILEVEAGKNIGGGGIKNEFASIMLECAGRKATFTQKIGDVHALYALVFEKYGHRARAAKENEGVDWKAMSHATRCCDEAIELLSTHNITFPLQRAKHLLDIKQGNLPYELVAENLEKLLIEVERAKEKSTLPDEPDYKWAEEFVLEKYKQCL